MSLWGDFKNKRITENNGGISLFFEKGIERDLRKEYIYFVKWLRKNYIFPIHINVYILNKEKIELLNGDLAYGSFRWFSKRNPIIKIPSLIKYDEYDSFTKGEIYDNILSSLTHELTHYYQWVKQMNQTDSISERQANYYRYKILDNYYRETKRNLRENLYLPLM